MFQRRNEIELLCRSSGVQYCGGDGQLHQVRQTGRPGAHAMIAVDHHKGDRWTKFTCTLPLRFPLGRTPDGIFARAMMRSINLTLCQWCVDIRESCDAVLYLCGQVPTEWLNPTIFGGICRQMREEVEDFHRELRDKFNYMHGSAGNPVTASVRQAGHGVPTLRPGDFPAQGALQPPRRPREIRYLEP